jgi:C4-dicarboxylate transporter DctM subunit
MMIPLMAILAIGLLVLGVPIWLGFLVTSIVIIFFFTNVPLAVVASTLYGSLDNFVLLAVPGFIFAGSVMARGGMTQRMIRWLRSLVGPVPGGISLTTIGAGELFGAITGSSAASTAALGKILYPALREQGYAERFSLGLVASSGAIAIIIPPSISMILYASVTAAPVGKLFIAGVFPGLLLGLMVGAYCIFVYYRNRLSDRESWNLGEIWQSTIDTLWTLGLPVIIFGGIYGGFTTPTEAAVLASFYALIVSGFVYRELDWKDLWAVTLNSAKLSSKIFLITASAGLFSWVLTINQVPQALVGIIESSGASPWIILLMLNALLLLTGMFIDPVSNVLVLTPILWPIAQVIGLDILHFGIIVVVNMAIGMFSPPFGLNIFIVCSIFSVSASRIAMSVIPFFIIYVIGLLIITFIPDLSLWLPQIAMR